MSPKITAVDHLVLTVKDLTTTFSFYRDVLGMKAEAFTPESGEPRWALKFGMQKINLHEAGAEFLPHAVNPTPGSADLCFLSDVPLDQWAKHLAKSGVEVELGPVLRTGATGSILSLYLRDPDGNLLEISNPPEKGSQS